MSPSERYVIERLPFEVSKGQRYCPALHTLKGVLKGPFQTLLLALRAQLASKGCFIKRVGVQDKNKKEDSVRLKVGKNYSFSGATPEW